jgi:hypothetical protein
VSKGNDLIEHPPVVAWIITDQNGFRSVTQSHVSAETMLRLGSEATSLVRLSDYIALRDTIASLSEALAEAEKKGDAWSDISTEPEVGRKVIALFDDGSGSMMLWRHDDGYVDQEGDEHSAFPPHLFLWRYLPDDFEFWCETTSEPLTLKLPPRDLSQGGKP